MLSVFYLGFNYKNVSTDGVIVLYVSLDSGRTGEKESSLG